MKIGAWLVMLMACGIFAQQWTTPFCVKQSTKPIVFQKHWIDQTDGMRHVLYAIQETSSHFSLYYNRVTKQGTLMTERVVMKGICHHSHSDITGAGDGRHVYMAVSMRREKVSDYDDIFIAESSDGGMTWKDLVRVPRHDMNDALNRYYPNIRYNKETKRLWIFYFASTNEMSKGTINFVTRPKGSSIFENEKVAIKDVETKSPIRFELTDTGKMKGLHLAFVSLSGSLYYFFSENSIDWSRNYCSQSYYILGDFDLAVHTNLPRTVYTLHPYKYNDKIGVRPLFSNNFLANCATGSYYWPTSFLPDVFSNKFCDTDEGEVFLSFGAKKQVSVGTTTGLLFARNLTFEDQGKLVKLPWDDLNPTFVTEPHLTCRYNPIERGIVSLSSIVFFEKLQKYRLYLTQAKLTRGWTLESQTGAEVLSSE